jgi:hypothetical protein
MLPMVQFARVFGRLVLALVVAGAVPSTPHLLSAAATIDSAGSAQLDRASIGYFPSAPPRLLSRNAVRIDASRRSIHGTAALPAPIGTAARPQLVAPPGALTCAVTSSTRRCSNPLRGPPSLL